MAWGRETEARPRRGRSILGTLMLFVLGIIAGGTAFHYYQTTGVAHVVEGIVRDPPESIGDLEDRLANIGSEPQISPETVVRQQQEIAKLTDQRNRLEAEIDALRAGEADADAGFGRQIVDLKTELGQARASLKIAEQVNEDLRSQLNARVDRSGEVEQLREELDRRITQLEQRDELLAKYDSEFVRLERAEENLGASREALEDARARIETLENELAELRQTREAEQRQAADRINSLQEKLENVGSELLNARSGEDPGEALERARDRIARLESELREARLKAAASEERKNELEEASAVVVNALKEELRDARKRNVELQSRLGAEPDAVPSDSAQSGADADTTASTPRDPLEVAGAIGRSAGLQDIDDATRDRIASRLIEGECVARVLSDEFGRAPAVALRDLLTTLDSDC